MKNYTEIDWTAKGANEAINFLYNELDDQENFIFFKFLIENHPNLELDWLEIFEDLKEDLFEEKKIDDVLFFVDWFNKKYPNEYANCYEFIERNLIDNYIYKGDWQSVKNRIAIIKTNPVSGIDTITTRLLFQLIYNGQYQLAIDYANDVWKPISESDLTVGLAAYPFINTIYVNELQKCYEAFLSDTPFDEEELAKKTVSLGFDDDKELFEQVLKSLKTEIDISEIQSSILLKKDDHMLVLNIHFLKFMLNKYQMPFVFSEWIWNFIATTMIFGKQKGLENWFYIDTNELDKHIQNRLDTFSGSNELELFGKVWGLDYVFQFLHTHQLISDLHFSQMNENITYFRNSMIKYSSENLWQLLFVFDWPKTHNYYADPSEKRLFNNTYFNGPIDCYENINKYFSIEFVPERIKLELNLKKNKNNIYDNFETLISNSYTDNFENDFEYSNTPIKNEGPIIGRNDPCICGSGKKYKKCCLK